MASDKAEAGAMTTRPTSAPKTPHIANLPTIPTIVLEPGTEGSISPTSAPTTNSPPPTSSQSRTCSSNSDVKPRGAGPPSSGPRKGRNQVPVRSSSDIGLPATSMPNLAIQIGLAAGVATDAAAGENYLGVYCSPRTSRRSVDLDINSKEETRGQYEWIETLDSSSNSLKVLTASSRVGSALSLNSECTTRSIGLLSNDSDSDDLSLSEKDRLLEKPSAAQLRRYLSYQEESPNQDTGARPSQSLCNLKQVDTSSTERALRTGKSLDCYLSDKKKESRSCGPGTYSSNHSSDTPSSQPSDQDNQFPLPGLPVEPVPPGPRVVGEPVAVNEVVDSVNSRLHSIGIKQPSGFKKTDKFLCYKCDANTSSRDGRIRQWLQDMDHHDYTE